MTLHGEVGYIVLLAVFALDAKHHALATHLARLRKPGLCGKTAKDKKRRKFHLIDSLPPGCMMSVQMCIISEVADRELGLTFSVLDSRDTNT